MVKREPVVRIAYLSWALTQPIPHAAKNVLIYLVRRADKNGECWPEQRTIAKELHMSTSTVKRCIRLLRLCGLILIIRTGRSDQYRGGVRNTYKLRFAVSVTKEAVRHGIQILKGQDQGVTGDTLVPTDQGVKNDRPRDHRVTRKIDNKITTCLPPPVSEGDGLPGGENPDFSEQDFSEAVND